MIRPSTHSRFKWASLLLASTSIIYGANSFSSWAHEPAQSLLGEHAPGEIVLKLRSVPFNTQKFSMLSDTVETIFGAHAVIESHALKLNPQIQVFRTIKDSDEELSAAIQALNSLPEVEYAEPNYLYRAETLGVQQHLSHLAITPAIFPNDPDFSKTWAYQNTGQADPTGVTGAVGADIGIVPLWNSGVTGSQNVIVAVLDTGIDLTHPDLQANIYSNPGESGPGQSGNGIDDDHNGFVDDVHGWNFSAGNNNADDDNGHGSHVAGTIGAVGNNGIGIAGVNWNVSLLPVKFLNSSGVGTLEGAIEAIQYAKLMKARVINNSWGGPTYSQALFDAVKSAQDAGIVFVSAAGNNGVSTDGSPTYPASFAIPGIISVAATDGKDQLATFSNYGATSVDLAAPGVDIYSTILKGQYATYSGTSSAVPFVSGVAALLISQEPMLTVQQIKDRLVKSCTPLPSLHRKVVSQGRLNAYNAIHSIFPPSPDPDPSLWKDVADVVQTPHPYANDSNLKFTVSYPGARYLRIHFQTVDSELYYDVATVTDPSGKIIEKLSGKISDYTTDYVAGDHADITFTSDRSNNGYGFLIDKIQIIE